MKKRNEGYALPFVLVVLIVMCLIVVGIMDFSLRNLKSQQNTILRMEAKYEAAGQIEQIIATLENNKSGSFQKSESLLFLVSGGTLKVAASGSTDNSVWIIAELEPQEKKGQVTLAFEGNDEKPETLTIKDGADIESVKIETYKVVDRAAAMEFVGGGN